MPLEVSVSGELSKVGNKIRKKISAVEPVLHNYGAQGVSALARATPKDTGRTASSWDYTIAKTSKGYKLIWRNNNKNGNENIAILIQYGHGTGWGGYVQGYDYINPAIRPIFKSIEQAIVKAVNNG